MSSLETDSHPNGINGRGSTPRPLDRPSTNSGEFEDDLPQLTSNVYNPAIPPRRPVISTNFPAQVTNANLVTPQDGPSPDPHEFYRLDQERGHASIAKDIGSSRKHSGGSLRSHRSRPGSPRSKAETGASHPPIASRIKNARYALASEQERSPSTKTSTAYAGAPRNRQTSLQELVNKFNQNTDQVPPLPDKGSSRSPSTSSSIRAPISRSGTAPLTRTPSQGISSSFSSDAPGSSYSRSSNQRRGRAQGDSAGSPKFRKNYTLEPSKIITAKPLTSQSLVDLAPELNSLPRKPLFGELFSPTSSTPQPGYGIAAPKRRRGSDGSLHSPNPLYADTNYLRHRDHSPNSPTAWYYGHAPPLEEIKAKGDIPDPPPNLHRRTRSESHGQASTPLATQKYINQLSPPASPTPPNSSRRSSQSRIPVSTRRISSTSDSGDLSSTTFDHSPPQARLPRQAYSNRAPPPKPLQTSQRSPRYSRSNTPQKSPRYQSNSGRPVTSPRLAAYITETLPKKSPPLRSSRPRQPVSSATTSASRARAVEKFTASNESNHRHKEQRHRKPPELGAVDFAARRQKIQQAFSRTVKEEEEREIRRLSMAQAAQPSNQGEDDEKSQEQYPRHDLSQEPVPQEMESEGHDGGEDPSETIADKELKIDTNPREERSMLDLDDSPTLGTFNSNFVAGANQHQRDISSPNSDIDPGSAITAGTSDSVDTFFDDEPQDGSYDSSRRPSTAQLVRSSYSANTQTSRTPSPPGIPRGDGTDEKEPVDDRESIQIMLGSTPLLDKHTFQSEFSDRAKIARPSDDPDSRWSMSTWTSSVRSGDDRDSQLERIEESHPATNEPERSTRRRPPGESLQPTWTPSSAESPQNDRTMLDSDRYSTINRVLDQYHDLNTPNREAVQEILQQTYRQNPDLMRQGGYDPRKVTQLYLQRMAQERVPAHTSNGDGSRLNINKRSSSLSVPNAVSEKEVRTDMNEKMPATTHSRNLSASSAVDHDEEGNLKPARASLSRPGDFDMSPSLGGFSEMAADLGYEERPPLPAKDAPFVRYSRPAELHDGNSSRYLRHEDDSRPQLPPMNFGGQSLEIKVEPPQRGPSPVGPPPPPPGEPTKTAAANYWEESRTTREAAANRQPDATNSDEQASMSQDQVSKEASPSPEQKRLNRRRNIIKELVDTEHSFGQDMKVVDDIYKGTSTIIVITPDDTKTLFGNSDQIVAFSSNFLDSLKQAARSIYVLSKSKRWKSNRVSNATSYSTTGDESSINGVELTDEEKDQKTFIGEAFGHHMAVMEKVYTEYLKNHDAANQRLAQLQKHSKVQIWLKECKAYAHDLTTAWDLDSLLVKPVQRVLKYPLLLDQLVDVTPENHPDYTALKLAAKEMKNVSMRINDAKKRADILEQVTGSGRKRKDSDMRTGLAKAFGAGKKLRQQVGTSGTFEDKDFNKLADKFSEHFVRLQIIMRDVEMYSNDVDVWMRKFLEFAMAIEALIDVGQTSYPELESKWRKFRMSMRDMSTMALPDHVDQIQKHVVQPMQTLVKLHEGPQRMMNKRSKRLPDYSRYLALKERGDKADKKTAEQAEQFLALNDTLKDEVPKLFELTNKLMERCLGNFVQLQYKWLKLWKLKLKQAIDIPSATQDGELSVELVKLIKIYSQDFAFFEGQVASLAICNGALLNETPNLVQFASPITDPGGPNDSVLSSAPPRATQQIENTRKHSVSSEQSPVIPTPDFGDTRGNGGFFPIGEPTMPGQPPSRQSSSNVSRARAVSNVSNHTTTPQTPQPPGGWRTYSNVTTPSATTPGGRFGAAASRQINDPPSLRPSTDSSRGYRLSDDSGLTRPSPGTSFATTVRSTSPSRSNDRFSGYFSSAMPMSDSPPVESPSQDPNRNVHVIFLAASVYEFNIDRARKEAGYPYLTYVAGEIFDVIGEKGELWLARNQDDRTRTVGWIWNKHFVKLAS